MSLAPLNRSVGHALITAEGLAPGGYLHFIACAITDRNHLLPDCRPTASVNWLLLLDRRGWSLARELTVLYDVSSTPQQLIILEFLYTECVTKYDN